MHCALQLGAAAAKAALPFGSAPSLGLAGRLNVLVPGWGHWRRSLPVTAALQAFQLWLCSACCAPLPPPHPPTHPRPTS